MIFIEKGNVYLGETHIDNTGNIVKNSPPRFEKSEQGSCVAVGRMNAETNEQIGLVDCFGDWQTAEILSKVIELIAPCRQTNIPNFKEIISKAYKDGVDFCEYCNGQCEYCIVDNWKNEEVKE